MTIAETIATQIGTPALGMLGANRFVSSSDSLQFRIGRNANGITHVRVCLRANDTYTVQATRVRGHHVTMVDALMGIHVDGLRATLEALTGLRTSL